MRGILIAMALAGCGSEGSDQGLGNANDRLRALEVQVRDLKQGRVATVDLDAWAREMWWCPYDGGQQYNGRCHFGSPEVCNTSAATRWAGCIPTRVVACAKIENGEPGDCYLTWGNCTGEWDGTGNVFISGRHPCTAFVGKEKLR